MTGVNVGVGAANLYDGFQVQVFGPQEDLVLLKSMTQVGLKMAY